MCVNNLLSKVALDSAAAGIEPAISSRKSNGLTTAPVTASIVLELLMKKTKTLFRLMKCNAVVCVVGSVRQEWSRLQDYITSVDDECQRLPPNLVFSPTEDRSVDSVLEWSCSEYQPDVQGGQCLTAVFR